MTEPEWLACTDLAPLMTFVQGLSERKLMLFGCACCYRQWQIIPDGCCKDAVQAAERFADGLCNSVELRRARRRVREAYSVYHYQDHGFHAECATFFAAVDVAAEEEVEVDFSLFPVITDYLTFVKFSQVAQLIATAVTSPDSPTAQAEWDRETAAQCDLVRDIVGNPFRPVVIAEGWLRWNGGTVVHLAQAVYDERILPSGRLDTGRLGILADALEDAGCTDTAILEHCRSGGDHVRGCWVVDALLNKK
jgi:hypothetical protein